MDVENNKKKKYLFFAAFSIFNMALFWCQIKFLGQKKESDILIFQILISIFGFSIFFLNLFMARLFTKMVKRFIYLLDADNRINDGYRRGLFYLIVVLLVLNTVNQDLWRQGSYL